MSEHLFSDLAFPGTKSDYTIILGELIAMGNNTPESMNLVSYPIYDEKYRDILNHKIMAHFALREIGQETFEQFRFYLGRTMNEIMPLYNQLYESAAKKFDPLSTTDITSVMDSTNTSEASAKNTSEAETKGDTTTTATSKATTDGESYDSEIPQTGLTDDFARYATHANKTHGVSNNDSTNQQNSQSTSNAVNATDYQSEQGKGNTVSHTSGYSGIPAQQLLSMWRNNMLNIDMMIINDLETAGLFMGLWGGYDSIF